MGGILYIRCIDEKWTYLPFTDCPMPEPRSFHAMCSRSDDKGNGVIYVFGGCGATGRLNDLWSFDASTREWKCLHAGGSVDAPVARGGASIVVSQDGSRIVLLFGFSGRQHGDIAV